MTTATAACPTCGRNDVEVEKDSDNQFRFSTHTLAESTEPCPNFWALVPDSENRRLRSETLLGLVSP